MNKCLFKKHIWEEMDERYIRKSFVFLEGTYKHYVVTWKCARCGKEKMFEAKVLEI